MEEGTVIIEHIGRLLENDPALQDKRIIVTGGPTREAVDPVRVITNRSSGKMGYALAEAARDRGAAVCLVAAPTALPEPVGVELCRVASAEQMRQAVLGELERADVLVMAAAVADYRPRRAADQKIKKQDAELTVELEPTIDILAETAERAHPGLVRVGFAAESEHLVENARGKLARKRLDLIVANDITLAGSGFAADSNKVTILVRDGRELDLPIMSKVDVAHAILDEVVALRPGRA
jgi:phosphopantothenoylcysteine decarboxylase/phosphopantothenate--cysteine ligase